MTVRNILNLLLIVGLVVNLSGCASPHFFTVTIYDSPDQVVKLQAVPDANNGQGFSHPADIPVEKLAHVMRGLRVEIHTSAFSLPFGGTSGSSRGQPVFSDREIKFFAPLFAKGLAQATPEELVTFYETGEISEEYQLTTSGGLFVKGDELHFLLSNHNVKTRIWQDNDQYEAPYHLRPLEPMDPEPGRLTFSPPHLMVEPTKGILDIGLSAEPWQVGVRYSELGS